MNTLMPKNIYEELGTDYVNEVCKDDDNVRPQSPIIDSETGITVTHPRRPMKSDEVYQVFQQHRMLLSSHYKWRCCE